MPSKTKGGRIAIVKIKNPFDALPSGEEIVRAVRKANDPTWEPVLPLALDEGPTVETTIEKKNNDNPFGDWKTTLGL